MACPVCIPAPLAPRHSGRVLTRMTTPQEFVSSFLRERAAVYAEANTRLTPLHLKYYGEPLSQHADDFLLHDTASPVFEEVKHSATSASVITR